MVNTKRKAKKETKKVAEARKAHYGTTTKKKKEVRS